VSVRPIVKYPDARLRAVAAPVTRFDDDLRRLAADLLDTMRDAPGVGITAPHIGVGRRVVVLEL
jgi:peptide deformylase